MAQIQIEGTRQLYDIDDPAVKNSIVRISNKYYWRDSDQIIKVEGRFYRKGSPLILKDYNGNFIVRATAVQLAPGVFASPEDANAVKLEDGTWTARNNAIKIKENYYLSSDPRLVTSLIDGSYLLKDGAIPLWDTVYGKNKYVPKSYKKNLIVCTYGDDSGLILPKHAVSYLDENGVILKTHNTILNKLLQTGNYRVIFWKFKNPNFPSPEHIKIINAHVNNKSVALNNSPFNYQVLAKHAVKLQKQIDFYNSLNIRDSCDAIRARLNSFYDEAGPDENTAVNFNLNYDTFRGGGVQIEGGGKLVLSNSAVLTGGKKYTFGVEIETSAGLLDSVDCRKTGVSLVADSSIGSGEYTTQPLHGDTGIKQLEKIMDIIHAKTLVDNRCAVHVHIGGATDPLGKNRVDTPHFNTEFGVNAIRLGIQLEDEFFASMPPYRQPDIKYCSGIKLFSGINMENYKEYLGAYVFGPETEQLSETDITEGIYAIGRGRNSTTEQQRWCNARYKWLNLVNAFSKGRFSTIEFRIFGATTRFDKVYNYVLTAMAFVWFVENRSGMIVKGNVTLNKMFDEAYADHPELAKRLKNFYDERIVRFAEARAKSK